MLFKLDFQKVISKSHETKWILNEYRTLSRSLKDKEVN